MRMFLPVLLLCLAAIGVTGCDKPAEETNPAKATVVVGDQVVNTTNPAGVRAAVAAPAAAATAPAQAAAATDNSCAGSGGDCGCGNGPKANAHGDGCEAPGGCGCDGDKGCDCTGADAGDCGCGNGPKANAADAGGCGCGNDHARCDCEAGKPGAGGCNCGGDHAKCDCPPAPKAEEPAKAAGPVMKMDRSADDEARIAAARPEDIVRQPGAKVGDITRCPISGDLFVVAADQASVDYKGQPVYFCCPGCIRKFQRDPEKALLSQ